jgi:hypothetical protein
MADKRANPTFWGWVTGAAVVMPASIIALPVAVVSGAVSAANGGTFKDGAGDVYDRFDGVIEKAIDFGDKHGETFTRAVISGVVSGVVGTVTGDVIDHSGGSNTS